MSVHLLGRGRSVTACGHSMQSTGVWLDVTARWGEVDCGLCGRTSEYKRAKGDGIPSEQRVVTHYSMNGERTACGLRERVSDFACSDNHDSVNCIKCQGTLMYRQEKENRTMNTPVTVEVPALSFGEHSYDEPDTPDAPEILPMGKDHDAPFRSAEGPHFAHDCAECVFLGSKDRVDLYWCPQNGEYSTVIARHGDDGPDYVSGLWHAADNKYLAVAVVRAFQSGHLSDEDMALL